MASLGNPTATENRTDLEETAINGAVDAAVSETLSSDAAALVRNPRIGSIRERLARESRHSISSRDGQLAHPRVRGPRVSLVIPARNEALNLPIVFETIPADIHEIIVVDGDSTDGTADVARSLGHRTGMTVKVVGQTRPGKGNALMSGFRAASGDILVTMDADGSMSAGEIPLYVDALTNGADFVRGSRFMEDAGTTDITPIRWVGAHGLRVTANVLFGTRYTDLLYGYCAFWRSSLYELAPDCDGFEFEAKMNLRAHTLGRTVVEVPSMEVERVHGASNLNAVRDGLRILRVILGERMTPKHRRVPQHAEAYQESQHAEVSVTA